MAHRIQRRSCAKLPTLPIRAIATMPQARNSFRLVLTLVRATARGSAISRRSARAPRLQKSVDLRHRAAAARGDVAVPPGMSFRVQGSFPLGAKRRPTCVAADRKKENTGRRTGAHDGSSGSRRVETKKSVHFIFIAGAEGSGATLMSRPLAAPKTAASLGGLYVKTPQSEEASRLTENSSQSTTSFGIARLRLPRTGKRAESGEQSRSACSALRPSRRPRISCSSARFLSAFPASATSAFGYGAGKITITEGEDGQRRIVLNDRPATSIGTVRQVSPSSPDAVILPFPVLRSRPGSILA